MYVKLDLFHAVRQRIVSKIPKPGKKGSILKDLRRRLDDYLRAVGRIWLGWVRAPDA